MIVFDIQKFSTFDGPGIRTSVFLKGCMMRCPWCHNPESLRPEPELSYSGEKCSACRACGAVCPAGVHSLDPEHRVDFLKCTACGNCISACPQRCLKLFGREMSPREIMTEVLKDKKYYQSSGGGMTVTGGEPTMQFEGLMALLHLAKAESIHCCLETNGVLGEPKLKALLPLVDLFLLDYKATGEDHKRLTGVEEAPVLNTLSLLHKAGKPVILRCPIIPGLNDTKEHFAVIRRLKSLYSCILQAEIMAYHSSGIHKWNSLGLAYSLKDLPSATPDMKRQWEKEILP